MAYKVEVTDTFGGQANYCWVHRYTLEFNNEDPPTREIVRAAKKAEGWTGMRCDTYDNGDQIEVRPRDMCQVMFINWVDDGSC